MRSFFTVFFFLAVIAVFVLFYTDFLASIVTLKEIRKENAKFFTTSTSTVISPAEGAKSFTNVEIAKGVFLTTKENSKILREADTDGAVILGFYSGHAIVEKSDDSRPLVILMPDLKLTMPRGKCNIFYYDDILRIIPLTHPIEIEYKGKKQEVLPGFMLFLLNKKEIVISPGSGGEET